MEKGKSTKRKRESDDLRPEYRFDYSKAQPNRFASALSGDRIFRTTEAVNNALRAIVSALPKRTARVA